MGLEVSNRRWFNSPHGEARFLANGPAATLGEGLARSREQSSGVLMASCMLPPCPPGTRGLPRQWLSCEGTRVREEHPFLCPLPPGHQGPLHPEAGSGGREEHWEAQRPWEERPMTCSLFSLDRGGQGPLMALASWFLQGPLLRERRLVLLLFPPSAVFSFLDLGSFGTGGTLKFPLCPYPGLPQA